VVFYFSCFLNQERSSASNRMCYTNSGMKENKECYCKIHLRVLNSNIEKEHALLRVKMLNILVEKSHGYKMKMLLFSTCCLRQIH